MRDLSSLGKKPFLVLGRAGMDLYADPPGTEIEQARKFEAHLGGSAANIATALSRQGCAVALLTRVSDDAVGRFVLAELDRYGIDRRHVGLIGQGFRTSLAVVETRIENCQAVIYRNGAADFQLTTDDVNSVDMDAFGCLVITGTALADAGSRDATMLALSRAKSAGLVTVMDVDYRAYTWTSQEEAQAVNLDAAKICDIVIGNDVEFDLLGGAVGSGMNAARKLVADGASIAVYKMGEKGAVTLTSGLEIVTGVYRTNAIKPTGAGDAFMGGFLASLAQGRRLRDSVLRGSAAAAIVVSRVGCAPASPTIDELNSFMSDQPDPETK